ncbi:MAG: protein translocase subunit SecF, partial [Gammaproteobacteria bacterium]|nr:protein translocase subunit SecF [Gammaproteobacteria bacterium]
LVLISLIITFTQGLNIGIDFTGGSAVEIRYSEDRPDVFVVRQTLEESGIEVASIRAFGDNGFMFQLKSTDSAVHDAILEALTASNPDSEAILEMADPHIIGPSIGAELRSKAWIAMITVSLAIIIFIAYAFRHASEKVSSWKYGTIAIVALAHDIIIPTGLVALLGMEVSSLFVIALLAILGLSVNDTIVVFDRVRENIKLKVSRDFSEIVGKSLEQTFVRSINTSLTTLFVVGALFFLGPESTKDFVLVLATGLIIGTYSSIFLASPLLVEAEKKERAQKDKK